MFPSQPTSRAPRDGQIRVDGDEWKPCGFAFDGQELEIVHSGPESSELALSLREELTGIQYGRVEDRYGWLTRLDA